jgi:prevent-host-death family protein
MKKVAAGQFKNTCLALMDEVQRSGEPVLITKHGKPVAKLVPAGPPPDEIFGRLAGRAKITGDIVSATDEDWECK